MDRINAELLLGLKSPYSEEDVSAAYKRAIRENHPDVLIAKGYSVADANERAKQINIARDFLLDGSNGAETGSYTSQSPYEPWGVSDQHSSDYADGEFYEPNDYQYHTGSYADNSWGDEDWGHSQGADKSAPPMDEAAGQLTGETLPEKREGGAALVFAGTCAVLGVAAFVSSLLVWPVVKLPVNFVTTHFGTCAILGPPSALICAIVSRITQKTDSSTSTWGDTRPKRLRHSGLACAGFEYVYLAIWAWFLN